MQTEDSTLAITRMHLNTDITKSSFRHQDDS